MSFIPTQDRRSKHVSRTFTRFLGCHYGYSKIRQPDQYAAVQDFKCLEKKLELRDGKRKNHSVGFLDTVTALFSLHIGSRDFVATIANGVLSAVPVRDVLVAERNYYTWDEAKADFTWDEAKTAGTWEDFRTSRNL